MALQLDNFITPENQFEGLYKMGDTLQRNRAREEQQAQHDQARKATMTKMFMDYSDPKDHLSGSPLDSQVTKGFMDIQSEAMKLISENKGLTSDMLLMALAPKVKRLAEYSTTAKTVKAQIEKRMSEIPESSGYDKFKLGEIARQTAFFNEDGTMKNLGEIPAIDWVAEAVKNRPEDVTNNKGLDEWLSKEKMIPSSIDKKIYNSRGGFEKRKSEVTSYGWAVPEEDDKGQHTGKYVPEYEYAHDGDKQILFNGKPVKVVSNALYKRILGNSPGTADWLRGEIRKLIKDGGEMRDVNGDIITENSPHSELLAKKVLFDEMKTRGLGGMKEIIESKPTQFKIYAPRQESEGSKKTRIMESNLLKTLREGDTGSGEIDVTNELTGFVLKDAYNNEPIIKEKIGYNPETETFSITDEAGKTQKVSHHKFSSMAFTNNPNSDINFFEGFKKYKREPKKATAPAATGTKKDWNKYKRN